MARSLHGPTGVRARPAVLIRLLACVLVGLAACTPAVRVGSTGDYPPFSERSTAGWSGFDVEVARAWSHDRGRRLVLVPLRWPDVESALQHHEVDVVMSGVTVRADRLLEGRFTSAVARDEAVLVGRRGAPAPVHVAVNRGGHLERLARARLPGARLELVDDNRRLRALLDAGTVDGIVTDTLELHAIAPDAASAGLVVVTALSDDRKAYFLPADAASLASDLDAWLLTREADGWLPALRARLLGDGTPEPQPAAVARVTDLLARRLMVMPAVAAAKRASGLGVVDAGREAEVEARAVARATAAGLARRAVPGAGPRADQGRARGAGGDARRRRCRYRSRRLVRPSTASTRGCWSPSSPPCRSRHLPACWSRRSGAKRGWPASRTTSCAPSPRRCAR